VEVFILCMHPRSRNEQNEKREELQRPFHAERKTENGTRSPRPQ
jgi:hypothetical protein